MQIDDPIDFAQVAISRVADIASLLGREYTRPVCGRLGAELLLVASNIDTAGLDQENRLRLRIFKLLRDVETICNFPNPISKNGYQLLEAIGQSLPGLPVYKRAQTKIRRGLTCLTDNPRYTEQVIVHIKRFTKGDKKSRKRDVSDDTTSKKSWSHPERPRHVNELVHRTLREYVCCTCQESEAKAQKEREHLVRLLLQPPSQQITGTSLIQFDMLFSSTPFRKDGLLSHWQDVVLLVPNVGHTSNKKRARFADADQESDESDHINSLSAKRLSRVDRGQFCNLIALESNSCLCLSIQDGHLHHCFEPLRQLIDHVPGISLADLLRNYRLTARMKLVLAYIIAYSVWQYYDSDWMKTKWTSETIQFMKESGNNEGSDERPRLFTWKPYLSVQFNNEDPECYEFNKLIGGVHDYPRMRALGIMLVEIGIGSPFHKGEPEGQPLAAKVNNDLLMAVRYTKDDRCWQDFDYPDYMSAVSHCLDPGTFNLAPYVAESSPREWKENLKQRRNTLYDKVVFPLEELLQGTKWMEDLTKLAPLEVPSKVTAFRSPPSPREDIVERTVTKKKRTKSERKASEWLARLNHFNRELSQIGPSIGLSGSPRVRIAILDTGYDDNAPFFFSPDVNSRLKGWKDCVNESEEPNDFDGHGTHLVSLVMKCAPEADIYVARVAKNANQLLNSSEKVAEGITWASRQCKADIISMSFGFVDEQPCIIEAIRDALAERKDSLLFFAAASNHGGNEQEMFPARHPSVISVRGTDANGFFKEFNPPKSQNEEVVIGTLGLDVPSAWCNCDEEVYLSGTSPATAIAAGIAGILLGYIRSKPTDETFRTIKDRAWKRQGMHAILRTLASPTLLPGYMYLTPWILMGKPEDVRWANLVFALSNL